ncbi:MAG: hypothetical protein AB1625_08555, partial [Acidobacteriota bacterium]
ACSTCVATAEVADAAVTKAKLSATGGTDGQVLKLASGALSWANDTGLTLPYSGSTAVPVAGPAFEVVNTGGGLYGVSGAGAVGVYGNGSAGGVLGSATSTSTSYGVKGTSVIGTGVLGETTSGTGVQGTTASTFAVLGRQGTGTGLLFITQAGVWGDGASAPGVVGASLSGHGVEGHSSYSAGVFGGSGSYAGVSGLSLANAPGVEGTSYGGGPGVRGTGTGTSRGVEGLGDSGPGVYGSSTSGSGLHGTSTNAFGVLGESSSVHGVHGSSDSGEGIHGFSTNGYGVHGVSTNGDGVFGEASSASKSAFYGINSNPSGYAAYLSGNVQVNGDLNVTGTKNFLVDHPLDPENRALVHAAVESSEVLNVYSGNVVTDEDGRAVVELPEWFEAVNTDFRYQLTVIGRFAQAIVEEEIAGNRFAIRTNLASVKVSWQVTARRNDSWMRAHPFEAERAKPEAERGLFLAPAEHGQPEEKGVGWARRSEAARRGRGNAPDRP